MIISSIFFDGLFMTGVDEVYFVDKNICGHVKSGDPKSIFQYVKPLNKINVRRLHKRYSVSVMVSFLVLFSHLKNVTVIF